MLSHLSSLRVRKALNTLHLLATIASILLSLNFATPKPRLVCFADQVSFKTRISKTSPDLIIDHKSALISLHYFNTDF